ncbi:TonB-dependent receptor [Pseudomaricurvus alcaniphilus]|uniref:TonB-dependent receptor n=1 Tax=Pseudomaricurvus alcaniphilus TaxID=1166482 RepID=UPI00140BD8C2|nr:TonB-dependent receptor [Pseudomaricurvus alcaniphilus]NHN39259.1 TonB-dependent receptor [Pseudomaricurvus alcaniphilus]
MHSFYRPLPVALLPLAAAIITNNSWSAEDRRITEEVVVSASPLNQSVSDNPHPVSVLSGDALQRQASATLGATLQGQVGVSSASFGPGVGSPVIRGQSANRVKVMQDNLDTLDAANASGDHANAVEPLLADGIEILRGPQTLRFGSGAIGGVINIIDSRVPRSLPQQFSGAIETRHSSSSDESASVIRLDGAIGQFGWHMDGLYRDSNDIEIPGRADGEADPELTSDGYIANSDSLSTAGSAGGSWIGQRGFIGASVNYSENLYGIPPRSEEDAEYVQIAMRQTRYDVKGELGSPLPGFELARLRLGYVDYQHTELEDGDPGTVFASQAAEGRIELLHNPFAGWQGVVGIQWLDRDFGAIGEEAFIPQSDITSVGVFAIEGRSFGNLALELGARAEYQDIDPQQQKSVDHSTSSLFAAGQYRLSENQRLNLSLNRAQRAPSIEELYSDGAHLATSSVDLGNAALDPETSVNWEIGYRYQGAVELEVNAFYNDISDFIYKSNSAMIDTESGLPIYVYTQQGAVFKGLEAQLGVPVTEAWELRLFADTVRAELDDGADVPRITPRRIGAEVNYTTDQWQAGLRATRASRQDHPGDNELPTAGWTRVDAHLTWHLQEITVFANAGNLLDEDIRNASSYLRDVAPEAGRNLTLGARYRF